MNNDRRTGRAVAILCALGLTALVTICPPSLPAAPPAAKKETADSATNEALKKKALTEFRRGKALYGQKKYTEAVVQFAAAARDFDAVGRPIYSAAMYAWKGACHRDAGDDNAAVKAYTECTRRFARLGRPGMKGLAVSAGDLAKALKRLQRYDAAAKALDKVVAARIWLYGLNHYRTIDARLDAADLRQQGKLTDEQRRQLAEADRRNGQMVRLYRQGKYAEAAVIAREVLRVR